MHCIYSAIPRMTYQTFKSIEVAKHYIFGQNIRKIEVKSRKIGIPFTLYIFFINDAYLMHHVLLNAFYDI